MPKVHRRLMRLRPMNTKAAERKSIVWKEKCQTLQFAPVSFQSHVCDSILIVPPCLGENEQRLLETWLLSPTFDDFLGTSLGAYHCTGIIVQNKLHEKR
mmetsp:Transcript_23359/g.49994  ORF Transcript_23359/g.49994 Transcript_23359/m.49994 type:complete len:99 (+) Transcript_23359:415-711(+)